MTSETLEKKTYPCPWKGNVEFQYNSLSEEKKSKFIAAPEYVMYERCLKCPGYDDTCPKYLELKKLGAIK